MLVVETHGSNQDLVPVPSQVENYKLMEKNFGKANTPQRFSESESDSQQQHQYHMQYQSQQKPIRNRFNSINENNSNSNSGNMIDFALSTSPTFTKFQLGGISPSGGIGSGGSTNKFLLHNLGEPVLIDDLEEETILDVIISIICKTSKKVQKVIKHFCSFPKTDKSHGECRKAQLHTSTLSIFDRACQVSL
jgi:hypothetical protein